MKTVYYFFRTIYDVGFLRTFGRIKHEIKKKFFHVLPGRLNLILSSCEQNSPKFKSILNNLQSQRIIFKKPNVIRGEIKFNFLNDEKVLNLPINWNSTEFSHLWRFNLHYFDWARKLIEESIVNNKFNSNEISLLNYLIDDWIDKNIPGHGDGWHSYTTSIRIRNWILIFRTCKELVKKKYLDSLWNQICWLNSNKEIYLGGNHWIENLITLVIGSSQFDSKKARKIYLDSLKDLEKELKIQILSDGGHIERSASYHLLILDRLTDLGLILENIYKERPKWLCETIFKMNEWAFAIKLENGNYPRFNDSPDLSDSLDSIIYYASCFLEKEVIKSKGIKNTLSLIYENKTNLNSINKANKKNANLIQLLDTGWIISKLNNGIELMFKLGESCPKYLPAHAHSDLLSFDLFQNGKPLIVEVGTSIYGENRKRYYERSGEAHNIFQLAPYNSKTKNSISWIEPVEVWGNFRAARKAKILEKTCNILDDGSILMRGSNDAIRKFGASYSRTLKLKEIDKEKFSFEIIDKVNCSKRMYWRQFWHLGPDQNIDLLRPSIEELRKSFVFEEIILNTWLSCGFGKREKRKTLKLFGVIDPGLHCFENKLIIRSRKI